MTDGVYVGVGDGLVERKKKGGGCVNFNTFDGCYDIRGQCGEFGCQ